MSRLNAPRERLLKPWHLALAVVGFIAAFVWIAPARQSLSLQDSTAASDITELDLAYLKAERASTGQSSDDVLMAATVLVRAQRIEEAEALLKSHPEVRMSHVDELAFSLERSVIRLNEEESKEAPDAARINQHKNSIILTLTDLSQNTDLKRLDVLIRSKELASAFEEHAMSADFAERLALLDRDNSIQWYRDCAVSAEFAGNIDQALTCATRRSALTQSDAERFNAQMDELRITVKAGDEIRSDELTHVLLESNAASVSSLATLAEQLLGHERPLYAARTYAKLADKDDPGRSAEWLRMAARWAEAGGKPAEAAVYLDSIPTTLAATEQDKLDDDIARLLSASGDKTAMLDRYRQKIAGGDTSKSTLLEGLKHAIASNEQEQAREWNDVLIEQHPGAIEGWVNRYDLSLGATDLPSALLAARTLVDLQPAEPEHRVRLAKVAEWSGDPELATQEWLWLSERYPTMESLTELTRLSTLTLRSNITAEALRKRAMLKKPSHDEIKQLITAYELEGRPDQVVSVLEELLSRYGSDSQWMTELAVLHARHKNYLAALDVWQRYEVIHGKTVQSGLFIAEMLWRTQQPMNAMNAAERLIQPVKDDPRSLDGASDYQVRLLAEISWRYELPELNRLTENQLARIDDKNKQVQHRERTIELAEKQGRISDAVFAAEQLQADTESVYTSLLHMRLLVQGMKEDSSQAEQYEAGIQPYLAGNRHTIELRQRLILNFSPRCCGCTSGLTMIRK